MGYCVLHFQKVKGINQSLGNHIDRIEGREFSYRHADPYKRHLNREYADNRYVSMAFNDAIRCRVQEGYTGKKAIRKDATYAVTTILSASHEDIANMTQEELDKWVLYNKVWCANTFGGMNNIVRFTLHMDEKTPHIHCVWVPITDDGRLSAKDWIGSGKKLEQLQSSYADVMEEFGLKRGNKVSDLPTGADMNKHVDTEEWRRKQVKEAAGAILRLVEEEKQLRGAIDREKQEKEQIETENALELKRVEKLEAEIAEKNSELFKQTENLRILQQVEYQVFKRENYSDIEKIIKDAAARISRLLSSSIKENNPQNQELVKSFERWLAVRVNMLKLLEHKEIKRIQEEDNQYRNRLFRR